MIHNIKYIIYNIIYKKLPHKAWGAWKEALGCSRRFDTVLVTI